MQRLPSLPGLEPATCWKDTLYKINLNNKTNQIKKIYFKKKKKLEN